MEIFQGSFCEHLFLFFLVKKPKRVLPWWYSGWESACQCRGPSSIPLWEYSTCHRAVNPRTTTTEPGAANIVTSDLEPALHCQRRQRSKKPAHGIDEEHPHHHQRRQRSKKPAHGIDEEHPHHNQRQPAHSKEDPAWPKIKFKKS